VQACGGPKQQCSVGGQRGAQLGVCMCSMVAMPAARHVYPLRTVAAARCAAGLARRQGAQQSSLLVHTLNNPA